MGIGVETHRRSQMETGTGAGMGRERGRGRGWRPVDEHRMEAGTGFGVETR